MRQSTKITQLALAYRLGKKAADAAEKNLRSEIKRELLSNYAAALRKAKPNTVWPRKKTKVKSVPLGTTIKDETDETVYCEITAFGLHDGNFASISFDGAPINWLLKCLKKIQKLGTR